MGNKSIVFFKLWIILGNVCATFSSDHETVTGADFGEFTVVGNKCMLPIE